jgi:hypothetical protein
MNRFKKQTAVAIITCNREDFFEKAVNSIDRECVDRIYVINNGAAYKKYPDGVEVIQAHRNPTVVGIGKNVALREMSNAGYEYLFVMEDDVFVKNNDVFEKYIVTAADSGLWAGQLSYGLHGGVGGGNVSNDGTPLKVATVQYTKNKVDLYKNSYAAFVLYHRNTLKHIGYMDERYLNAAEHLDHYYKAFLKNLGNYYWYFPDIENSFEYLEDQAPNHENSFIRNSETFKHDFSYSWQLFKEKFGIMPHEVKEADKDAVLDKLYLLEKHYARKDLL